MFKSVIAGLSMVAFSIAAASAQTEILKPIKDSKNELAGAMFKRKDALKEDKNGNVTTDVATFTSGDSAYETGMFKSGPAHEEIKGPRGFPYNEFLYFISGGATLTSADGSVMVMHAGEAVTIPKGWIGTFDTQGYTKLYATYNPDDIRN